MRRLAFLLLALVSAVGIWASDQAARHFERDDPGPVVIDEVAGQLLTQRAEASAFGVSFVGMLTSSRSVSFMPADSSAWSSRRWLTKPTSTPIFLPLRSASFSMPGPPITMSLPFE